MNRARRSTSPASSNDSHTCIICCGLRGKAFPCAAAIGGEVSPGSGKGPIGGNTGKLFPGELAEIPAPAAAKTCCNWAICPGLAAERALAQAAARAIAAAGFILNPFGDWKLSEDEFALIDGKLDMEIDEFTKLQLISFETENVTLK